MNARNIQHPDITAAERTGYPMRHVCVEVTDAAIRNYITEDVGSFLDFCFMDKDAVDRYLDATMRQFENWCKEVLES